MSNRPLASCLQRLGLSPSACHAHARALGSNSHATQTRRQEETEDASWCACLFFWLGWWLRSELDVDSIQFYTWSRCRHLSLERRSDSHLVFLPNQSLMTINSIQYEDCIATLVDWNDDRQPFDNCYPNKADWLLPGMSTSSIKGDACSCFFSRYILKSNAKVAFIMFQ